MASLLFPLFSGLQDLGIIIFIILPLCPQSSNNSNLLHLA
nr:MAG TPA: hypothetical protein [Caudoviricetes sp.]